MEMLARWAGDVASAGGAVMVAMFLLVVATDPATTPAWNLLWVVVALLGAGVLGLYERTKTAVGGLGRASAWVSVLGALGLLLVAAYSVATNQLEAAEGAPNPLWPLWIGTVSAWLGGNIVFALALIGVRSQSSLTWLGAWLVVAGAALGLAGSLLGGQNPPAALFLLFVPLGVGWIVLGQAATRQPVG